MIELEIHEPGLGLLSTLIDARTLEATVNENMPYVRAGTTFTVGGEVVATKGGVAIDGGGLTVTVNVTT